MFFTSTYFIINIIKILSSASTKVELGSKKKDRKDVEIDDAWEMERIVKARRGDTDESLVLVLSGLEPEECINSLYDKSLRKR